VDERPVVWSRAVACAGSDGAAPDRGAGPGGVWPLVQSARIDVGEYTYYDSDEDPLAFERDAVLYGFGPERLIIGRFCAIASGVRFLMPGANHADLGPSTYPFGVFGAG
jgi:hypothetical protein